jgi:hypothetical protein
MSKNKRGRDEALHFSKPPSAPKNTHFNADNAGYGAARPHPWFSFRHICQKEFCPKKCPYEKLKSFTDKLRQLSELDWSTIDSSPHETNGFELIPVKSIRGTGVAKSAAIAS